MDNIVCTVCTECLSSIIRFNLQMDHQTQCVQSPEPSFGRMFAQPVGMALAPVVGDLGPNQIPPTSTMWFVLEAVPRA